MSDHKDTILQEKLIHRTDNVLQHICKPKNITFMPHFTLVVFGTQPNGSLAQSQQGVRESQMVQVCNHEVAHSSPSGRACFSLCNNVDCTYFITVVRFANLNSDECFLPVWYMRQPSLSLPTEGLSLHSSLLNYPWSWMYSCQCVIFRFR